MAQWGAVCQSMGAIAAPLVAAQSALWGRVPLGNGARAALSLWGTARSPVCR